MDDSGVETLESLLVYHILSNIYQTHEDGNRSKTHFYWCMEV